MSGIKNPALTEFYRSLRERKKTTDSLAVDLGVAGSTVRKLIGMHAPRGGATWRYLLAILTERERELLESMEQSSTWNVGAPEKQQEEITK